MKKLLLASMIAIASAFAIAPASADSIQLGIGVGPGYNDNYYGDDYRPYRHHRYYNSVYDDDNGPYVNGGYVVREHRRHHCRTELVSHWRHHHRVVEEVRVCG